MALLILINFSMLKKIRLREIVKKTGEEVRCQETIKMMVIESVVCLGLRRSFVV